jgi:hypothetical protein
MLARLLSGILASVLPPLGATFVTVGLLDHHPRRGRPPALFSMGAPLLVVGLAPLSRLSFSASRSASRVPAR